MFALIQDKIRALGCTVWELSETSTRGWEFYFIRHELDQNRVTEVKTYQVTLYRPLEGGFLGSASGEISPTASVSGIEKTLADIYFQASLVKNPVYRLNDKPVASPEPKDVDTAAIAKDFITAMSEVEETGRRISTPMRSSYGISPGIFSIRTVWNILCGIPVP